MTRSAFTRGICLSKFLAVQFLLIAIVACQAEMPKGNEPNVPESAHPADTISLDTPVNELPVIDHTLRVCLNEQMPLTVGQITEVECRNVHDASGVESLVNLERLHLSSGQGLRNLDLSRLSKLKELFVSSWDSNDAAIDVSGNSQLEHLTLYNAARFKDLSKNINLHTLEMTVTYLDSLDLSPYSTIKNLRVDSNTLQELILPIYGDLENLTIENTRLSQLDSTGLPNLRSISLINAPNIQLDLSENRQLEVFKMSAKSQVEVDLSHNQRLRILDVVNSLGDTRARFLFADYPELERADFNRNVCWDYLGDNEISPMFPLRKQCSFDQSKIANARRALSEIEFSSDLKACIVESGAITVGELNRLSCRIDDGDLEGLQHLTGLKSLRLESGSTPIDPAPFLPNSLLHLEFYYGDITDLDLSTVPNLNSLDIHGGDLRTLDLSENTELVFLRLSTLQMDALDLLNNSKLRYISLAHSTRVIQDFDFSYNPELVFLHMNNPDPASVNLRNNSKLSVLKLYWKVSDGVLDLTGNPKLSGLVTVAANIDGLDLSSNPQLPPLSNKIGSGELALMYYGDF